MKRLVVVLWIGLIFSIIVGNAGATTILPLYAAKHGFTDLSLYDSSLEWGTVTVGVEDGTANFLVEIDQSAIDTIYPDEDYYIVSFAFMSKLSFDLSDISINDPAEVPWTTRSPGIDAFGYQIHLFAYDTPPETAPSFNSLNFCINNLTPEASDDDFLLINWLWESVYGYSTSWAVFLRFPDHTIEGTPNTLFLYSNLSGSPSPNPDSTNPVPEPTGILLYGVGLATLAGFRGKFQLFNGFSLK